MTAAMSDRIAQLKKEIARFARERDWEQFHTPKNLAMALAIEAAEVAEIFQWLTPAQAEALGAKKREDLADELADTYVLLLKLADAYGVDLVDAARRKLVKAALKYPVEKAKGVATKYDEL